MKIIKDIKYLKMLTRYKHRPDDSLRFQIAHCLKNLIDLDKVLNDEGLTQATGIGNISDIQTHNEVD